jgi:hypothetical protein
MVRPIGIAGVARCGKDSLFKRISRLFGEKNSARLALADELKQEIDDTFLLDKFGISAFTINEYEKDLVRPIIIAYAHVYRVRTEGTHWSSKLQPKVKSLREINVHPIITDIRFDEYENDEVTWLHNNDGILVYLEREQKDGSPLPPPNSTEAENDPKLRAKADVFFSIPTYEVGDESMEKDVDEYIRSGLEKYF